CPPHPTLFCSMLSFYPRSAHPRDLHSFPTRRSSDLGVLCTHPPDFDTTGISVIIVKDTEAALLAWVHYVLDKLGTQVVCVGGTSDRKSTRLNSSHVKISYAVFCLKKKKTAAYNISRR